MAVSRRSFTYNDRVISHTDKEEDLGTGTVRNYTQYTTERYGIASSLTIMYVSINTELTLMII